MLSAFRLPLSAFAIVKLSMRQHTSRCGGAIHGVCCGVLERLEKQCCGGKERTP